MEKRVRFEKGKQKEFLRQVIVKLNCPSLKDLTSYDSEINYDLLKKYYQEKSLLPYSLFSELCKLSGIKLKSINCDYIPGNWGQVRGGKIGIIKMKQKHAFRLLAWRRKGGKNRWK